MTGRAPGTLLAFDFGSQSIGVAAGSPAGGMATPLSAVRAFKSGPDWAAIDDLVREWQPSALVVGLALNPDSEPTTFSRRAQKFGERLRQRYNLPVHWVDERLTTEAARGILRDTGDKRRRRKADVDNTAAALILDSFLNERR